MSKSVRTDYANERPALEQFITIEFDYARWARRRENLIANGYQNPSPDTCARAALSSPAIKGESVNAS